MSLLATIDTDLNESMRQRHAERTGTLRMLKTALKNKSIADRVPMEEMTDEQVVGVVRQEAKKRRESIDAFTSGGRSELAAKEQNELLILQAYLPPSMSSEEIAKIIDEIARTLQLAKPINLGQLMGPVMKAIAGRADGQIVREQVQKYIAT